MASQFQRQSLIRKWVYAGLILALFTGSFLFRTYVVEARANDLGLREEAKGEVELTGSAMKLTLTGSRGLAVCFMWIAAKDRQMKHEWNELELIVNSVVKLQPHFVSPWLFQSWNMSFNVPAELDSPHDKYFYITRGIQLLADGERRNQGSKNAEGEVIYPGNPNLRFYMGFYYQLKIGQSDEARTFRCLYQMSCMEPAERDPARLETRGADGRRKVNLREFEKFCQKHPRLVRRLRDQLGQDTPEAVVAFLRDHQNIPNRYDQKTGKLKEFARERFPVFPPRSGSGEVSDADNHVGSRPGDDHDNFAASRAWYVFAQEPLPRPDPDLGALGVKLDRTRYSLPQMNSYIFRQYPALANQQIAQFLADEGWFDAKEGWTIAGRGGKPEWFFDDQGNERDVTVGTGKEYSSGNAWQRAYESFRDYGVRTLLIMPDEDKGPLHDRYRELRKKRDTDAKARAIYQTLESTRTVTNFPSHLYEADAERSEQAVRARKHYFEGQTLWAEGNRKQALDMFDRWIKEWRELLTKNENYRQDQNMQEDSYEQQLKYLRKMQEYYKPVLIPLMTDLALSAVWPTNRAARLPAGLLTQDQRDRIIPARQIWGPFDEDLAENIAFFDADTVQRIRKKVMHLKRDDVPPENMAGRPLTPAPPPRALPTPR